MNPERWHKIEEIFQTVVEHAPGERAVLLTQFCGNDTELRREVESLLNHEVPGTFIQDPIKRAAASVTRDAPDQLTGQRIGVYQITSLIGHGGMGAVYAAVRADQQFEQQVALKIIRRGMETAFVRRRFLRERQILASLEHPNIARLLDGGTTAEGLPYFVMEYVPGIPITEYCRGRLSLNEKLQLFRAVCAAVQHAHQKLVVHRDLKPSNILVTPEGTPKLLDFGIAKLLAPEAGEDAAATRTETALRLMTPEYASPEQARGQAITTATDIYSLGVVLYELLTDYRPYQFKTYAPAEIERAICETQAARPSDLVERMKAESGRAKGYRFFAQPAFGHPQAADLRGDLDNIILMALRKEPERRYQSVEQFSADLRRYQEGRPVLARGDTFAYRAFKFVRRNRVAVGAGVLMLLSLFGGLITTSWQARRAERRFAQVRKLANTFLFDFHDKIQNLPGSTEARELVVATALEYLDSLAQEAGNDPGLQLELAQAYLKVGDVQGYPLMPNLGHSAAARASYSKAVALAQKLRQADEKPRAAAHVLANGYRRLGVLQTETGDKQGALVTLRLGVAGAEQLAQTAREPGELQLAAQFRAAIGTALQDTGDVTGALGEYQRAAAWSNQQATRFPGVEAQTALAASLGQLAQAKGALGEVEKALADYQQAAQIYEALLKAEPHQLNYRRALRGAYSWLGTFYGLPNFLNQGDTAKAIEYARKALALAAEIAAQDAKNVQARSDLASCHGRLGDALAQSDPARATEHYRRDLTILTTLLAEAPNEFRLKLRHAIALTRWASHTCQTSSCRAALQTLRQARATLAALAAQDPANTQLQSDQNANLRALALAYWRLGEPTAALTHAAMAAATAEKAAALGPQDLHARWRVLRAYADLGWFHSRLGSDARTPLTTRIQHWQNARAWYQKALPVWQDWQTRGIAPTFTQPHLAQITTALAQSAEALTSLNQPTSARR
jgi:serine/threonine protein kinase